METENTYQVSDDGWNWFTVDMARYNEIVAYNATTPKKERNPLIVPGFTRIMVRDGSAHPTIVYQASHD